MSAPDTGDELPEDALPRAGTLARWAYDYVTTSSLAHKLSPPPLPVGSAGDAESARSPLRIAAPGRPAALCSSWAKYKAPRSVGALRDPRKRASLLHTFLHHELQAAELMCWAVLAFPDTPRAFRRGLLGICLDEVRHMGLYAEQLARLGFAVGAFPVRDWFWQRTPSAATPRAFVSVMALGFEAGNLDHSERYVALFREAGDPACARVQEVVADEERAHVAFGVHWFRALAGGLSFGAWCEALPAPLSPMVMRGKPLARAARLAAGFPADFLDELEAWQPASPGS